VGFGTGPYLNCRHSDYFRRAVSAPPPHLHKPLANIILRRNFFHPVEIFIMTVLSFARSQRPALGSRSGRPKSPSVR